MAGLGVMDGGSVELMVQCSPVRALVELLEAASGLGGGEDAI